MSFKGTFSRVPWHMGRNISFLQWSLTIKCTNFLMGETVDIGLFPSDGSQPWYFRNVKFKAGGSYIFDKNTIDWEWYQGDFAAILGPNGKIIQKFEFRMKEYGPGECPECHGTKICRSCGGHHVYLGKNYETITCPRCNAGECPTCDIPYRVPSGNGIPTGLHQF